jgi:phosphoglucosamine mutase
MKKLFGTDGIRGIAGEFPLDPITVGQVGLAMGHSLVQATVGPRVILGRDTRESGEWISGSLTDALQASGVKIVQDAGIITTPGLAYLARFHQFDLGVMISASHNPFRDNGIKVFSRDGCKLPDDWEVELEKEIYSRREGRIVSPKVETMIGVRCQPDLVEHYKDFLVKHFHGEYRAGRMGMDLCNGSAYSIAPAVFRELGAEFEIISAQPDGRNINLNCGSLHLEPLVKLVQQSRLEFGVAFDGDADRSLFVTSSGKIFDGDHVLYALAKDLKSRGGLRQNTVVGTVMTNFALELALKREGIHLARASVGDKYVLEEMNRVGANLGGEPSGHIILSDLHTTGDGLLTAVKLSELLSRRQVRLDELIEGFQPFPQVLMGLRVSKRIPLVETPKVAQLILSAEEVLGDRGRVVVRYSGTEPLLRIMAEGEDAVQVRTLVLELKNELEHLFASLD